MTSGITIECDVDILKLIKPFFHDPIIYQVVSYEILLIAYLHLTGFIITNLDFKILNFNHYILN